ncbi:MAG: hypothetical protein ACHQ2Y_09375 [Candidatus Lutacidiplasmatales archaeon]
MNASTIRVLGVAPVLLYGFGVLAATSEGWPAIVVLTFLLTALPIVPALLGRESVVSFVPSVALFAVLALASAGGTGALPTGVEQVGAGLLLGAPIWVLAFVSRRDVSSAAGVFGLTASSALTLFLLLIARTSSATYAAGAGGAEAWWPNAVGIVDRQATIVRLALPGATLPTVPLSYAADPVLVVLVLVGAFAMLSTFLRPEDRTPATPARQLPTEMPLGPWERPALRDRAAVGPVASGPTFDFIQPPPDPAQTGVLSLTVAILATLAFEAAAAVSPATSLLALSAGAAGLVVAVVVVARPPRATPDAPAEAAG